MISLGFFFYLSFKGVKNEFVFSLKEDEKSSSYFILVAADEEDVGKVLLS